MLNRCSKAVSVFTSALLCVVTYGSAFADSCYDACGEVLRNPIFRTDTTKAGSKYTDSFRSLLCSAEWKTYNEAQKAGISVDIPIFDMAVPLDANWDLAKKEAWQKKFCSSQERSQDYSAALYTASYQVDPITATTFAQCMSSCTPTALSCSITETDSSIVFEAKWRRGAGELDSAAPTIKTFTFNNTACSTPSDLAPNKKLGDGSVAVLCSQNLDIAPTFLLVTSRGSCTKATDLTKQEMPLSGKIVLDRPTSYKAPRLALESGLKIVTNGYPLSIVTGTLVIKGAAEIVSFEGFPAQLGQSGRSAAEVRVQADRIQGSGLTIKNSGEDGAKGTVGLQPEGHGPRGAPGGQRYFNLGGCQGGHDGGLGSAGAKGGPGGTGGQGGAAGEVILAVKRGLDTGAASTISVVTRRPDRSGTTIDCNGMICGGLGGAGGDGGAGQLGGLGGDGASGTATCGGTNPGPNGPQGVTGDTGKNGLSGANALVKRL